MIMHTVDMHRQSLALSTFSVTIQIYSGAEKNGHIRGAWNSGHFSIHSHIITIQALRCLVRYCNITVKGNQGITICHLYCKVNGEAKVESCKSFQEVASIFFSLLQQPLACIQLPSSLPGSSLTSCDFHQHVPALPQPSMQHTPALSGPLLASPIPSTAP